MLCSSDVNRCLRGEGCGKRGKRRECRGYWDNSARERERERKREREKEGIEISVFLSFSLSLSLSSLFFSIVLSLSPYMSPSISTYISLRLWGSPLPQCEASAGNAALSSSISPPLPLLPLATLISAACDRIAHPAAKRGHGSQAAAPCAEEGKGQRPNYEKGLGLVL